MNWIELMNWIKFDQSQDVCYISGSEGDVKVSVHWWHDGHRFAQAQQTLKLITLNRKNQQCSIMLILDFELLLNWLTQMDGNWVLRLFIAWWILGVANLPSPHFSSLLAPLFRCQKCAWADVTLVRLLHSLGWALAALTDVGQCLKETYKLPFWTLAIIDRFFLENVKGIKLRFNN